MSQGDKGMTGAFKRDEADEVNAYPAAPSGQDQTRYLMVPLPPPKILLLDDDITIRQSLSEDFTKRGIEPHCVETTGEAKSLLVPGHAFKVIFVDIKLRKDDITGDRFILENRKLMGGAKVAAITAEFYFQDMDRETLAKLFQAKVEIIPKRKNFSATLIQTVESVIAEEKSRMLPKVENFLRGEYEVAPPPPEPVHARGLPGDFVMMLEQLLLDWLKSRQQPDRKRVLHGGRLYSYNEIASEIEQGTELGQAHLKMMASLFMRTMSIDS